jgi:hypothetical protein
LRADVWPQNSPVGSVRRGGDLGAIRAGRLTVGLAGRGRRIVALAGHLAGYEEFRRGIFRILRRPGLRSSHVR